MAMLTSFFPSWPALPLWDGSIRLQKRAAWLKGTMAVQGEVGLRRVSPNEMQTMGTMQMSCRHCSFWWSRTTWAQWGHYCLMGPCLHSRGKLLLRPNLYNEFSVRLSATGANTTLHLQADPLNILFLLYKMFFYWFFLWVTCFMLILFIRYCKVQSVLWSN